MNQDSKHSVAVLLICFAVVISATTVHIIAMFGTMLISSIGAKIIETIF